MRPGCCQSNSRKFRSGVMVTSCQSLRGTAAEPVLSTAERQIMAHRAFFLRQGKARAAVRPATSQQLS